MTHERRDALASLVLLVTLALGCGQRGVRIGAIVPETGELEAYGTQVKRGIELARERIDARGGFAGGPLEIVYRDDGSSPAVAERAIRELTETQGIEIVIGGVSSDVLLAIAPIAESKPVVLLSPSASAPEVTEAGDFVFRNFPSDVLEGTSMADFAREAGLESVVIFCEANSWGAGLTRVFRGRFDSRLRRTAVFEVDQTSNVDELVAQGAASKPDGVYLVTYVETTRRLLPRLREAGIEAVLMGTSSLQPQVLEELGQAADRLVLTQPAFDAQAEDEAVREFVSAYRQKYAGSEPDIYAAHGYDALMLLWTAMNDARSADAADVGRALYAIDRFQGAAGLTSFDDKGDVVRYPRLFVVQNGTAVPYLDFKEQGGTL